MNLKRCSFPILTLMIVVLFIMTFLISSCQDKEAKKEAQKQEHYQNAMKLKEEGKLNEAIIEFKNAIQQDPNFADAYYQLGLTLLEQGKEPGQGYGSLMKAAELDKNNLDARLRVADLYFNQALRSPTRDFEKVDTELKDILEIDPNNARAYLLRARVHSVKASLARQDGDEEQAEQFYTRAFEDGQKSLDLDPENAEAYVLIGQLHLVQENMEEARQAFEKAIELDANNTQAYLSLASMAFREQDVTKAQELYQKVLTIDAENAQALTGLGEIYLSQNEYEKAIEQANAVLANVPDDQKATSREGISARFILGRAYLLQASQVEQEDPEAAKKLYEQAKQELEPVVNATQDLASAYYSLGLSQFKVRQLPTGHRAIYRGSASE